MKNPSKLRPFPQFNPQPIARDCEKLPYEKKFLDR
jgi:hypothetical protein